MRAVVGKTFALSAASLLVTSVAPPPSEELLQPQLNEEAQVCAKLVGTTQGSNYKQLASTLAPITNMKKGTFETTEQFDARKQDAVDAAIRQAGFGRAPPYLYARLPIYLSGVHFGGFDAHYNADTAELDIEIVDPTNEFYRTERHPASKQIDQSDTILLSSAMTNVRSDKVMNAFGATTTMRKEELLSYYWVYEDNARYSAPIHIRFTIQPAWLQQHFKNLRVLLVGKLVEPYVHHRFIDGEVGTFTKPSDSTEWGYMLYATPQCAALYDQGTSKVLSAIGFGYEPLPEESPTRVWLQLTDDVSSTELRYQLGAIRANERGDVFQGIQFYSAANGNSERLIIGPFRSASDAAAFGHDLKQIGITGRVWANPPHTVIKPLGETSMGRANF